MITRDPRIRSGRPQTKGTPVDEIYGRFIAGASLSEIRRDWLHLTTADIEEAIRQEVKRRLARKGEDYYPMKEEAR